jgi:hypothetical protein
MGSSAKFFYASLPGMKNIIASYLIGSAFR